MIRELEEADMHTVNLRLGTQALKHAPEPLTPKYHIFLDPMVLHAG